MPTLFVGWPMRVVSWGYRAVDGVGTALLTSRKVGGSAERVYLRRRCHLIPVYDEYTLGSNLRQVSVSCPRLCCCQ